MSTEHAPLLSPWYHRVLAALTVAVFVVAVLAGYALREATSAAQSSAEIACAGANQAKASVQDLIETLVANSQRPIPNATPEQIARQQVSTEGYKAFLDLTEQKLHQTKC